MKVCRVAITTAALATFCFTSTGLSGCSVYRAVAAPSQKDLTVLKPGTARDRVIAELGPPVRSETVGDTRKDLFTFLQGYSTARKTGLATIIAVLDVASLGAAETAGPLGDNAGEKMSVAVYYDASDLVTSSETILVTKP